MWNYIKCLILILAFSFCLSLLAKFFWVFDIFSHFAAQYAMGGCILCLSATLFKKWNYVLITGLIGMTAFVETRLNLQEPTQFFSPSVPQSRSEESVIKLVQYNHNIEKVDFTKSEEWLRDSKGTFDVVVLQEASEHTVNFLANNLKLEYPYQIREPRSHAFGMVVLSKHPFLEKSIIPIDGPVFQNFALRLKLQITSSTEPLVIYALHAVPPMGLNYFQQRNHELLTVGKLVSKEVGENIVMIGDWNITPYSPYFKTLLSVSNLNFQSTGVFLNPSWPDFNKFSLFKIPIDHTLHSDGLEFLNKEVGASFGSDHHSIISTFAINKK